MQKHPPQEGQPSEQPYQATAALKGKKSKSGALKRAQKKARENALKRAQKESKGTDLRDLNRLVDE